MSRPTDTRTGSRTRWLPAGVHAELHVAPGPHGTAVVLVPPFGWEEIASARVRREWSEALAASGHPVLRLDLPGTGDSADAADGATWAAWLSAVAEGVQALRRETACPRVALVGLGLGGLLAAACAAAGADADDLVLWGTPAKGRALVRQLRAFAAMQLVDHAAGAAAGLRVNGLELPADVVDAVGALDLGRLDLQRPGRRVLLLSRDTAVPDEALAEQLRSQDLDVTAARGPGFSALVEHAQRSTHPHEVQQLLGTWLGRPEGSVAVDGDPFDDDGWAQVGGVRERTVRLQTRAGEVRGVLTEGAPGAAVGLLLLNSGAVPRSGPNRLWTRAAREAAARGVPSLRVDVSGVGDSPGPSDWAVEDTGFYDDARTDQVREIAGRVTELGLPSRLVAVGLCSGAFWSYALGQEDTALVSAVMLNPLALEWCPRLEVVRKTAQLHKLTRWSTWRKVLRLQVSFGHALRVLLAVLHRIATAPAAALGRRRTLADTGVDPLVAGFRRLRERDVDVTLAFSAGEPMLRELQHNGLWDQLAREDLLRPVLLGGPEDSHTLPAVVQQEGALAQVDQALERALARQAQPLASAP